MASRRILALIASGEPYASLRRGDGGPGMLPPFPPRPLRRGRSTDHKCTGRTDRGRHPPRQGRPPAGAAEAGGRAGRRRPGRSRAARRAAPGAPVDGDRDRVADRHDRRARARAVRQSPADRGGPAARRSAGAAAAGRARKRRCDHRRGFPDRYLRAVKSSDGKPAHDHCADHPRPGLGAREPRTRRPARLAGAVSRRHWAEHTRRSGCCCRPSR